MVNADKLVWIDLEMTGLDPHNDVILEIATIVTDARCNMLTFGPNIVIKQPQSALTTLNEWVAVQHDRSGLLEAVKQSTITLEEAEYATLNFLQKHVPSGAVPLCGNSVWKDRQFLSLYMPQIHNFLHYRIIDVSSIKELVRRWYPENKQRLYKKPETHRAFPDILDSINELKHYRSYFFV